MDKLFQKNIVKEMEDSFIDYSMSVIVSRALPDLRDGLKPVHRRILYAMYESGVTPDKPYRKSARTVGDVMGKYHPHGDTSIYDAMVRMAQNWSYRYMLVDGQGNFGNQDGDGAAAMRYTEARLSKISTELLKDINKNTVDFIPNFDEEEKEPIVLPSRFPNILVNGTMGIAVGMATNIPPHNLGEVIDGVIAYINNKNIENFELMDYIKGPDFPTGGMILGNSGIKKAYETGKGSITIRGKATIEETKNKTQIVITELPYQVNNSDLQKKIGELVRDKVIDGIADLEDISSNPLRFNIIIKKDANPNVILNQLYKHTQLQTSYGINLLMIDQGRPKILNLKDIISKYTDYQREIIIRRTRFDLKKAMDRVHILEGLKIALDNIDEVIKLIRAAKNDSDAKEGLINKFNLSEIQAEAILEMKLRRLTGLSKQQIEEELETLQQLIKELESILKSEEKVLEIIKQELLEIKQKYNDNRKTIIDMTAIEYIEDESLIPVDNIIISLTNKGYIKRIPVDTYRSQNRGGMGIKGMTTNEEDFVEQLINLSTHDFVLFFTNKGRVYRVKGYEIPEYSRQAKGLPIVNLLSIDKDESVNSILKINKEEINKYIIFATKKGTIKRASINDFENIRRNGKIALKLIEDDELISVKMTNGANEIVLVSSGGRLVRFKEDEVRVSGRISSGIKGIKLDKDLVCVGAEIVVENEQVLIITENGYGKRTPIEDYKITHRGAKGIKTLNTTEKNGKIVAFKTIFGEEDLMIITNNGIMLRLDISNTPLRSRVTQGVKLINLKDNTKVGTIAVVAKEELEDTTNIIEEKRY